MITPAHVAVELSRPTPSTESPQFALWQSWIEQARLIISNRLGDLDLLDQPLLDLVVLLAVAARVRRPDDDATTVDIAVDNGRVSKTYRTSTPAIVIRDEWWQMLTPAAQSSGAFTVTPAFEPGRHRYPFGLVPDAWR